jgi:deoxyribose-phosphate aldolase
MREPNQLAVYIDHTLLKQNAGEEQIGRLCEEAKTYHFHSVCVNPSWVRFCARRLSNSPVHVCTVIGFPLGATDSETKRFETERALHNGANEVDMVINMGHFKSGNKELVEKDILGVVNVAHPKAVVKVIIETALLTDEEKAEACRIVKSCGADFVKTSTGFANGGATVADVELMRETVGPEMGIKAAGGIKTYEDAVSMIDAGATRLGASSGVAIVTGENGTLKGY